VCRILERGSSLGSSSRRSVSHLQWYEIDTVAGKVDRSHWNESAGRRVE